MTIELSRGARTRFRNDLSAHRGSYALTDAVYADKVLGIALNTLKRCLAKDVAPLTLKPQTFLALCRAAQLDPQAYGIDMTVPDRSSVWGGYRQQDYPHLAGTFLLHRRSFLTAENIIRGVLLIGWDDVEQCLTFSEHHSYETDAGVPYETMHRGRIAIPAHHNMLNLVHMANGDARLTIVTMPDRTEEARHPKHRMRTRGVVLTYGNPRDVYQPIVSAVMLEKLQPTPLSPPDIARHCKTLRPGSEEFRHAAAELRHAEENAVVMTPLLWRKNASAT